MAMAMMTSSPALPSISVPWRSQQRITNHLLLSGRLRCRSTVNNAISFSTNEKKDVYFSNDLRPIILFDGVCNLCNGGVNVVLDNDTKGSLRFAALQSEVGRALLQRSGRSPDDISSIVLVEKDRSSIKSDAVLRIANYLNVPFPLIAAALSPIPLALRDVAYDIIAANRYLIFGQTNSCRMSDASYRDRFVES